MPKKIIVNSSQNDVLKLPKFLYNAIKGKYTSLGDNPAIPEYGDFGYEYHIVKDRFAFINKKIEWYIANKILDSKDPDYLETMLGKFIIKCKKKEMKYTEQLIKLCENIVNKLLGIPPETVTLECNLVDVIKPKNAMRIMPENESFTFEDIEESETAKNAIYKRRFINALMQGFSHMYTDNLIEDYRDEVAKFDDELADLWRYIFDIDSYLLYVKDVKITEDNNMQNSYVEVHLGKKMDKTIIRSQAIIFPFLLKETIKGFFELFSSHSLPEDNDKAMYIIKKADFIVAEPWDLRLGIPMAEQLSNTFNLYTDGKFGQTDKIPYFFTKLWSVDGNDFNSTFKNILLGTKKGGRIVNSIFDEIEYDDEYQKFKGRILQKNIDTSLLMDDCFTSKELDEYVLSENQENELMAYHGTSADFDKFNHKKYLNTGSKSQTFGWGTYVTNDPGIANGYADSASEKKIDRKKLAAHVENYLHDKGFSRYETERGVEFAVENLNYCSIHELIEHLLDKELNMNLIGYVRKAYAEALQSFDTPHSYIYEVDVPEDNGINYIDWFETFMPKQMELIVRGFKRLRESSLEQIASFNSIFGDFYDNYINVDDETFEMNLDSLLNSKYEDFMGVTCKTSPTGKMIYYTLKRYMGNSSKAASLFLSHCGFDGIKYEAGTLWGTDNCTVDNPTNYVIFDANKVKIVKKTPYGVNESTLKENAENEITGYHGTGANFDKFNTRKYLSSGAGSQTFGYGTYITNDRGIAKGYADNARGKNVKGDEIGAHVYAYLKKYKSYDEESAYKAYEFFAYNIDKLEYTLPEIIDFLEYKSSYTEEQKKRFSDYYEAAIKYNLSNTFIYEVEIPDDNDINYIDWFNPVTEEQMIEIFLGFYSLTPSMLNKIFQNSGDFERFYYEHIHGKSYNEYAKNVYNGSIMRYNTLLQYAHESTQPPGESLYRRLSWYLGGHKATSIYLNYCGIDGIKYEAGTIYGKSNATTDSPMNYVIFDSNKVKIIRKEEV